MIPLYEAGIDRLQYAPGPHPYDGEPDAPPPEGYVAAGPWEALPAEMRPPPPEDPPGTTYEDGPHGEMFITYPPGYEPPPPDLRWPWRRALREDTEALDRQEHEEREAARIALLALDEVAGALLAAALPPVPPAYVCHVRRIGVGELGSLRDLRVRDLAEAAARWGLTVLRERYDLCEALVAEAHRRAGEGA